MAYRGWFHKIIFHCWGSYLDEAAYREMTALGIQALRFERKPGDYDMDAEFSLSMLQLIHAEAVRAVFSFNYYPVVSLICRAAEIPYITWIYDSPHWSLYSNTVFAPTNHIFTFDRVQAEKLGRFGQIPVEHLPLGVSAQGWKQRLDRPDRQRRTSRLSFVGSLYTGEHDYYSKMKEISEYDQGYLRGLVDVQKRIYGCNIVEENLGEDLSARIVEAADLHLGPGYFAPAKELAASVINKKVTSEERIGLLLRLGQEFPVDLYTTSDASELVNVVNKGYAPYETVMPEVFHDSRINLNMTLRTIASGIPLRVLDILACGGFLITNYQSELEEYFDIGRELVVYEEPEELPEMVRYYLEHEEEAAGIASAGRERVLRDFSLSDRIQRILSRVEEQL